MPLERCRRALPNAREFPDETTHPRRYGRGVGNRYKLVALAVFAAALFCASGSEASAQHDSATTTSAALEAANALMAQPWTGSNGSNGLAAQYTRKAQAGIAALSGKRITHLHGNGWHFDVELQKVSGSMNVARPPGFASASPSEFTIAAPLNGGWSIGLSGVAHADGAACCTPAGKNWFSVKGDVPFALTISDIRLAAGARLNASDPTRPTLTSAQISATAKVGGSGWFPGVPINLTATVANGAIVLGADVVNTSFSWGGVGAHLTIHLALKILPGQQQLEAQIGKTLDLSAAVQNAVLSLSGNLGVSLPKPVGPKSGSLGLDLPFQFPSSRSLNDALVVLQPPLPRRWPPATAPDTSDGHAQPSAATGPDFAAARDTLESGIERHLPYGTVLSIDAARRVSVTRHPTYGLENDSMIWSGHYLAAEGFRYAATMSPDALVRVRTLLNGIKQNFDVTTDAVVAKPNGNLLGAPLYAAVPRSYAGIFARSSMPNDGLGYTDGALDKRGSCYYVKPAGGWRDSSGSYRTVAEAGTHAKSRTFRPVGTITYGFGCGDRGEIDHPISRDQYLGLFMGLGYAYALIPDEAIRTQIRALVDPALGFLLRNNWNVPLPPTGQIVTTFIGDIDAQLALLRIGATVDPAKFAGRYQAVAAATDLAWIPIWFSTIDPAVAYFKFNLGHAALGPATFLESDPALKASWLRSYRILAAPTLSHRNAYFDLVDVLVGAATPSSPSVSNPHMALGAEITSDLADWLTRWSAVKGPTGMPRNVTSAASAAYLAKLWARSPRGVVAYTDTNGNTGWLADFVVPLWARPGNGMDFVWQRSPFGSGVDGPGSGRKVSDPLTRRSFACAATPPSTAQLTLCSAEGSREGPGIDFLLPYWLGTYLRVLPG